MKRNSLLSVVGLLIALLIFLGWGVSEDVPSSKPGKKANEEKEWTQWRGPNRDGISNEKIPSNWSEDGPKVLWRKPLGSGFSAITVSKGRLHTMFTDGMNEYVVCLQTSDGKEVWRFRTDEHYPDSQGGDGPRMTPLIDEGRVFVISAYGKLYALEAKDGTKIWGYDLQKQFGAQMPIWGFSMTPIVEDDLILTDVGGKSGHSLMAFDKTNGEVVWHSQTDQPGYSSPITVTVAGIEQAVFLTGTRLVSVSPETGKPYWSYPWKTDLFVNSATPILIPDDKIFISSNYGKGAALVQMQVSGKSVSVIPIWQNKTMKNHMATCVYHEGFLYGFDDATLKCIDAQTGREQWRKRGLGKGTLLFADGYFIVLDDRGKLLLIEATPEGYKEVANAGKVLNGRCWTVPTLLGGKLYIRNLKEIVCLDFNITS